jgi:hypothetical protein
VLSGKAEGVSHHDELKDGSDLKTVVEEVPKMPLIFSILDRPA